MGRRLWWGALGGATAGLAMLACTVGLAGLGQPDCLRPILALALPLSAGLLALGPGSLLHEVVAVTMGLLLAGAAAPLRRPCAALVALAGGAASMAALDAAVLAARAPGQGLMLDSPQSLEYLAFGLVLAAWLETRDTAGALGRRGAAAVALRHHWPRPPVSRAGRSEAGQPASVHPPAVLEILIMPHCFGCARARTLAAALAAQYAALDVRVVDLSEPGVQAPPGVVAVPSYVLNGRILFIGNPTQAALAAALRTADHASAEPPPDTP